MTTIWVILLMTLPHCVVEYLQAPREKKALVGLQNTWAYLWLAAGIVTERVLLELYKTSFSTLQSLLVFSVIMLMAIGIGLLPRHPSVASLIAGLISRLSSRHQV